jgi:hypothetical protein
MKTQIYVAIALVVVGALLAVLLATYNKSSKAEGFQGEIPPIPRAQSIADLANARASPDAASGGLGGLGGNDPTGNAVFNPVHTSNTFAPPACFPRDRLTADELLPKDAANSRWAQMNPAGQGSVGDANFMNAGAHIGVNTQGSSMRNPNLQLRSEPINPQQLVSPWNQSTVEPDLLRRPLEIGGDY